MITHIKYLKSITLISYMFYLVASIAYTANNSNLKTFLYMTSGMVLLLVHFLWQARCFYAISETINNITKRNFITLLIVCFLTCFLGAYLSITNSENHLYFFSVVFLMASSFIYASVLAAKQFSNYLSSNEFNTVNAWLPWVIAILYLPIGMFFIDNKLKIKG